MPGQLLCHAKISTFPPCIFSREARYGVHIPALCYEPKSRDDFLLKPRFFRQGSGCGCVCGVAPKTTPKPEKSWLK